jgi:hypothetical protein
MGMKEMMMERMIDNMSPEEKQKMMNQMMDKFFSSMTPEEKKDLMREMMPRMMENMFKDMDSKDKREMMMTMMPVMMEKIMGGMFSQGEKGKTNMKNMMNCCQQMMDEGDSETCKDMMKKCMEDMKSPSEGGKEAE